MATKKASVGKVPPRALTSAELAMCERFEAALGKRSANAVAKAAGVHRRIVDRMRKRERVPTFDVLVRIAAGMGDDSWIVENPHLAQSVPGVEARLQASGLSEWAAKQPADKVPSLGAALRALDKYDALRASGAKFLHSADGRLVVDWSWFFASGGADESKIVAAGGEAAKHRDVLDEAEADLPRDLAQPVKKLAARKK